MSDREQIMEIKINAAEKEIKKLILDVEVLKAITFTNLASIIGLGNVDKAKEVQDDLMKEFENLVNKIIERIEKENK